MAETKTKPTGASVDAYLASRASPEQLADCKAIMAMCKRVTKQQPKMWGPSIVGYGSYSYQYESGHSGDMCLAGFAVRGRDLVVYIMADSPEQVALLARLGRHKMGKSCLYFKRLADLDVQVLEALIAASVAKVRRRYSNHGKPATIPENPMKTRLLLMLTLAAPAPIAAQQPAPLPPNPLTAMFRTRTLAYQRLLAQAFDSIPESKFGYKPTPAQLTIGYVAQHLAADNYFYCNSFGPLKGTPAAADTTTADSVKATWPRDSLLAKLRTSFKFCEDALAQLDDAKLAEPFEVRQGANMVNITRAQRVVGHIIDLVDHYSQIAIYMRLNGMLPPSALPRPRP